MTDAELWQGLRKGSSVAFKAIYEQYSESLLKYGIRFTKDTTIIEDCLHDLFVGIWKNHATLGDTNSIMSYLCVSLRRDIIRRIQKSLITDQDALENLKFEAELSPEALIIAEEGQLKQKEQLEKAMEKLSYRQKEALYLRYYQEMDYEEICEIMNINYQSMRNLIFRALQQMREYMTSLIFILSFSLFL
jgi:RNA polymerase sigma factor (sigma-70 family)